VFPPFISDVFFDGYDYVGAHCGAHSAGDALFGIGNAGRVIALLVQDVGGQSDDLFGASLNAKTAALAKIGVERNLIHFGSSYYVLLCSK
jgi:hypothetical protein